MTTQTRIIRKVAILSLFSAMALALYMLESLLPPLIPVPGVKLGLSNIITLFLLVRYKPYDAAVVLLVRLLLAAAIAGQLISFLYSLCGGAMCLIAMWLLLRFTNGKFIVIISMIGALVHNAGQLLVARLIIGSSHIFAYFPVLMLSGSAAGLLTGLVCWLMHQKLPALPLEKSEKK